MKIKCTPFLRPLFSLVAEPGIGLPHITHEIELMISGAKPVLITDYPLRGGQKNLSPLIDEGKIILVGCSTDKAYASILCHPSVFNDCATVAKIREKHQRNVPLTDEDIRFRRSYDQSSVGLTFSPEDNVRYKKAADSPTSELELIRSGQAKSSVTLFFNAHDRKSTPPDIQEALDREEIKASVLSWPDPVGVFAQAAHVEEGREILSHGYCNSQGYPKLGSYEAYHKRVGQLLGYTENDTAYFTHTKYKHPLIRRLMLATQDFRREIRTELMLYDQKNSPK